LLLSVASVCSIAQQKPAPAAAEWWRLTTALANDGMEGRDTGTAAYERAAKYVAQQFSAYGLKPAGDNGTWFQQVAMHEIDLDVPQSSVELTGGAKTEPLRLLYETTLSPRTDLPPSLEKPLVFVGYGDPPANLDLRGKIAVFFNNTPAGLTAERRASFASSRMLQMAKAGVAGLISIDNPAATEPTHWPAAYARTVTLADSPPLQANLPLVMRISAEAAPKLFAGTSLDAAKVLADAEQGLELPVGPLKRSLRVKLQLTQKEISSPNVLAILPGTDPALAPQYVALSAHLDGYGYGTPVLGDNLYNGALDDAAYVATLLELAEKLAKAPAPAKPRRSLLFCIFTGEEKGLLGSQYFTQHPTVPMKQVVADLNLDQLRPIFPLNILTMEGITDSTLGDTVREVAAPFHIEIRPDREPERNLFRRADNYNFVKVGVPIASFIFGYDPGTPEERTYRDWYARRYHKPQDDLRTPIDWTAAVKFNDFYRALTLAVADAPARPAWLSASAFAPKSAK
jgi:hypothetical protein